MMNIAKRHFLSWSRTGRHCYNHRGKNTDKPAQVRRIGYVGRTLGTDPVARPFYPAGAR